MNQSVMSSFMFPAVNTSQAEPETYNQTISLADLTERPTESFQLSEDRATTEAYSLYHDFLNVFQRTMDADSNLPALQSYIDLTLECGSMLRELARQLTMAGRNVEELKEFAESIAAESSTWKLLKYIVAVAEEDTSVLMEDDSSAYMFSEKLSCAQIKRENGEVRHIQAIIDWLQSNANDKCSKNYYTFNSNTENTLHNIKLGKMELDLNPDCPVKDLHVLDRQEIKKFNSEIYKLIRAGRLYDATERCIESGQRWKAAMMEGQVLYHSPEIIGLEGDEEGIERRDLWKLAALEYSSSTNQSLYDRAAIGSLCGNTEPLLQIATSWEDRIWALLKGYLDVALEESIRSSTIGDNIALPASYWKQKVAIENLLKKASATTDGHDSMYRKIQEMLIENDFANLAEYITEFVPATKHEARFIAHLNITLQQLDIQNTSNRPIKIYSNMVAKNSTPDFNARGDAIIVAAYALQLDRDDATECFSNLLTQLISMNEESRSFFFQLAEKSGLDIFNITHRTVSSLQMMDNHDNNAIDVLLANRKLEDSIDLASKMIRNMIVMSRDDDAKVAIDKLVNAGALDIKNNHNFVLIKSHLEAIDLYHEWTQIDLQRPEDHDLKKPEIKFTSTFIQRVNIEKQWEAKIATTVKWNKKLKDKAMALKAHIMRILNSDSDWLDENSKSICIPRLVISSLKALIGCGEYEECIEVINLLFSEKHQLYKCLTTQTAPDILVLTAQATSKMLENGKTL